MIWSAAWAQPPGKVLEQGPRSSTLGLMWCMYHGPCWLNTSGNLCLLVALVMLITSKMLDAS
jgi:hypothetical protein